MDVASVFAALDLDPDDPDAADDVAVVLALVARRGLARARRRVVETSRGVSGPQIRRVSDLRQVHGPEVRWST